MALNNESQPGLIELFNHYPVLEALSSHLTIADSLALCRVCRGLDGLKNCMLTKISNINIRLKDFINDPFLFRSELGKYGALISGPFALNVIELGHRRVSHLDVFIKDGSDADQLTKYIQESEKYRNDSPGVETPRRVYSRTTRSDIKLRITRTSGLPIQSILTSSCTTACVNFITWNKAYSIFPKQTIIDHQFYPLRLLDNTFGSRLSELAGQGWTNRDVIWPDFPKAPTINGLRRVGDSSTLVIPLDTHSIQTPSTPDFVIDCAQFDVSQNSIYSGPNPNQYHLNVSQNSRPQISFLKISSSELTSPAVRYSYTTSSKDWRDYLAKRLLRWAWLEMYKLEPERRPLQPGFASPLASNVSIPQGYEIPQSWDYADDQIPRWYREWEQELERPPRKRAIQ